MIRVSINDLPAPTVGALVSGGLFIYGSTLWALTAFALSLGVYAYVRG
jgi:hypothetical protein